MDPSRAEMHQAQKDPVRSAEDSIETNEKEALKVRMLCLKLFQTFLSCIEIEYFKNTISSYGQNAKS